MMGWVQLGVFVTVAVAWSIFLLGSPLDPDYTSGELLDHLMAWQQTGVLYPSLATGPPYRVLNYPPLVFLVARGMTDLGVSPLTAGRLANMAGLATLVTAVTLWARARGAHGARLGGTVGLLAASFPLLYAAGQFHIELWAAAGTVAGCALLDRGQGGRQMLLAGLALAIACFAKQTQVVPAVVALVWAWRSRKSSSWLAVAGFLAAGLVGSVVLTMAWGVEPWRHMLLFTVGRYSLHNLGYQALSHMAPWILFLSLVGLDAWRGGTRARSDLLFWYFLTSLLWSLSSARVGSSYPYFLDLHLATALWVGPRLFAGLYAGSTRLKAAVVLQVVGATVGAVVALSVNVARLSETKLALPGLCSAFPTTGLVLSESPGLTRACGRVPVLHPFIMASLARQGLWDPSEMEAQVRAGGLTPVVLPFDPREPISATHVQRWTPGLLERFRDASAVQGLPAGMWSVAW